jgi:hypothetical protein
MSEHTSHVLALDLFPPPGVFRLLETSVFELTVSKISIKELFLNLTLGCRISFPTIYDCLDAMHAIQMFLQTICSGRALRLGCETTFFSCALINIAADW